jgi:hypothetical protein
MTTMNKCLMVCAFLTLPIAASAQSKDAAYCSALIDKYTTYLGSSGSGRHPNIDQDSSAKLAIEKCRAGDTAAGIPVLEAKLRDAKVDLPAHQ